jgi:hypothetical protein
METKILNLEKTYQKTVKFHRDAYDFIFRFKAGLFRPSMVKDRFFKKIDSKSEDPTDFGQIAHDLSVLVALEKGEKISFKVGKEEFFSKLNDTDVCNRLDIQILADNTTAVRFYKDCVDVGEEFRWIPNQGDPPPTGGGDWEPPF